MTTVLTHPSLGAIRGEDVDGAVQFKGIKYASLSDRFATAQLLTDYGAGEIDATKYGPQVLSAADNVDAELSIIQHTLPKPPFPGVSDIDGLNLNITVPKDVNGRLARGKLPVLVFIHGGGFMTGSNWWPQWNFQRLVKLSVEFGSPMIGIGISYRLGVPGFLTSEEMRSAGYASNNGLRDQRTALLWIQRYIGGFGGDPENVTVMGQSAGGVSTSFLLCSNEPIAKRLICLGGSPPMMLPPGNEVAEFAYSKVVEALDLNKLSAEERIKALAEIPAEQLFAMIPPALPLLPVIDGEIIPGVASFAAVSSKEIHETYPMPGKEWCQSLLVGDSQLDSSVFASMFLLQRKAGIGAAFRKSLQNSLKDNPSSASEILQAYDLAPDSSDDDDEALLKVLTFGNDVAFFAPAVSMAYGFPGDAFLSHFNEPNPWDGPFKGHTTHILDIAFLFQNFNDHLSPEQAATAKTFAEDVVTFVNGRAPWKAFSAAAKGACVYGGGKREYVDISDGAHTGRSETIFKVSAGVGLDKLLGAWMSFVTGT